MPAPLTPSDCDLRDFPFVPVDIGRLFGSEFFALASDLEFRAGFSLWLRSFHQVPAASLPDDDVALARLAELGRDVRSWRKVRAMALRHWAKCDDGRLYHPVVAEKALEAWIQKLTQRKASAAGNAKRYGQTFNAGPIEAAIEHSGALLSALNPASRIFAKRTSKASATSPAGTPTGSANAPTGTPADIPAGTPTRLPEHSQETGTGTENKREGSPKATDPPAGKVGDAQPTASKARRGRPARPDTSLPNGFALTPEMATYASKAGFNPAWLFEKFTSKAQAKGWTYRDWPAAFRNFAVTERQYAPASALRANGAWRPPDC